MNADEAFSRLLEEIEYATNLPPERSEHLGKKPHEVGAYLFMMCYYLNIEALTGWTKTGNDYYALCAIRKITAIGLRVLMEYGCPTRAEEMKNRES